MVGGQQRGSCDGQLRTEMLVNVLQWLQPLTADYTYCTMTHEVSLTNLVI